MFTTNTYSDNKKDAYELLLKQAKALLEDETSTLANYANASALLGQFLGDINWVGFYLLKENELVLGPFQGLPACTRISIGKGVCGTAVSKNQTMRVADVHAFPGHIACDAASNSEIVIPVRHNSTVIGVLDIDSPLKDRFSEEDQLYLEQFVATIEPFLNANLDF
ncbi:GAF domain-containing protein [Bacillus sp. Marseille-P3800]|uniref:GAF domain-containing protein n=1 Tax=Bacillus sp. Marseille-P3800 TaxID=2014782 RepID=UPI000C06A6C4|nr:GAF domain-containing protein [Bacillus sp. Marseille-P3800]